MTEDTSIGGVTWHSSEEDGGPDVGISVYLGNDQRMWCGEITNELFKAEGAEHFDSDGGWFLVHYAPKPRLIAKFAGSEVAQDFIEQIALWIKALKVASIHVQATNEAEHMMDGFGPRVERSSDQDFNIVERALGKDVESTEPQALSSEEQTK